MEETLLHLLGAARARGCECEVYGESMRQFAVEVHRGAVESMQRSHEVGLGVRVAEGGRIGFAYSSDVAPSGAERAFEEARRNAAAGSPYDADHLADHRESTGGGDGLYPVLPSGGEDAGTVELVREMERACLGYDASVVNTEGVSYHEVVGDVLVASTRGFLCSERRGFCSCTVSAVAGRRGEMRSGTYAAQALHPDRIDFGAVGREAARRAVGLLGSGRIATGRYTVVIDGFAFTDVVALLAETLSGEMAVKGMSPLVGLPGRAVARDVVTVIDDPFMVGACFNAGFDAEGTAKERRTLIEDGILRSFLHDAYSARRHGVEPPGNAVRESYKSRPVPGPSNLSVVPGGRSAAEIVSDVGDGILVQCIMGVHTADAVSGDFSVGISGRRIRRGVAAEPLGEMTMTGNVLTLLGGIIEVGSDLVFAGSFGAPTVLVEGASISGS